MKRKLIFLALLFSAIFVWAQDAAYHDFMAEGHRAYSGGDFSDAEYFFYNAMYLRPQEFAPYYYLGLVYYENGDHNLAEYLFMASLHRGADRALVSYALGLNAAAAGRLADALNHLDEAVTLEGSSFEAPVNELKRRLGL